KYPAGYGTLFGYKLHFNVMFTPRKLFGDGIDLVEYFIPSFRIQILSCDLHPIHHNVEFSLMKNTVNPRRPFIPEVSDLKRYRLVWQNGHSITEVTFSDRITVALLRLCLVTRPRSFGLDLMLHLGLLLERTDHIYGYRLQPFTFHPLCIF